MASVTRATLRADIRQDLACWPIPAVLDVAMDANSNQLSIPSDLERDFVEQKMLLEIDTEIIRVVDRPKDSNNIRVIRGFMGTTKAGHIAGAAISILPSWGWTDYELNNRILPQAFQWLKPHAWVETLTSTFTWSNNTIEATAPSGVSYPDGDFISRLLVLDNDGNYRPFFGWHLLGNTIRFTRKASADHTLKARIVQFQPILSSDTTTLDNDNFREAIVKYSAHLCLNALKANRVRYYEYSAALSDRASTPDELIRVAFDLKNQAIVAREEQSYPRPAGFAKTFRESF